jgi:hypothetical protein
MVGWRIENAGAKYASRRSLKNQKPQELYLVGGIPTPPKNMRSSSVGMLKFPI